MCTVITLQKVIEKGKNMKIKAPNLKPEDRAMIVYTSGTLGEPLGTILSHHNMFSGVMGTVHWIDCNIDIDVDTCYLAYLSQAHISEFKKQLAFLVNGVPIGYSRLKTMFRVPDDD